MTYNEDGNEESFLTLDAEGNEVERRVSTYEHGDRVQEILTNANGETCTDNTFDGAHHLLRMRTRGPRNEEDSIQEYNDRALISAWAVRFRRDHGPDYRGPRIEADVRTTWWEYEFYE